MFPFLGQNLIRLHFDNKTKIESPHTEPCAPVQTPFNYLFTQQFRGRLSGKKKKRHNPAISSKDIVSNYMSRSLDQQISGKSVGQGQPFSKQLHSWYTNFL